MICHFILYVRDQEASRQFYGAVLGIEPSLHVPGMTEFTLAGNTVLGLMPEAGIKRLLGDAIADPGKAAGIPRAELYLQVEEPAEYMKRAESCGARVLSPLQSRNWGHRAGYVFDPDGHVLAFAQQI